MSFVLRASRSALARVTASTSALTISSRATPTPCARALWTTPVTRVSHGLDAFVDANRDAKTNVGRGWLASELRKKSHEDLHALWHALVRERNMLLTEKHLAKVNREPMRAPQRMRSVRRSMARIKLVLTERAIEEAGEDKQLLFELKRLINAK